MAAIAALPWMYAATTLLQAQGLRESGRLARIQGQREEVAGQFMSWNAEREAGLAIAISHRRAAEERRQADLVASRALAVVAASGGGVTDPTVVRLIAGARGEGVYRANVALYEGEAVARRTKMEGIFRPISNSGARAAGYDAAALGTLAGGAMSLYAKYGMNGPGVSPSGGGSGDAALLDAGSADFSPVA